MPLHTTVLNDAISGTLFILSLQDFISSFTVPEIILLALTLGSLETKTPNTALLYASFFYFAFSNTQGILMPLNIFLLFNHSCDARTALTVLLKDRHFVLRASIIIFISALSEVIALLCLGRNARRKLFHFAGFFLFVSAPPEAFRVLQYVLYALICLSTTRVPGVLSGAFTTSKDFGRGVFSHIFLLAALVFPRFYLCDAKYTRVLISVCIMDSFASITGTVLKKKCKSLYGFLGGQAAALTASYLVLGTLDYKYHATMGLLECIAGVNDNILLPIAATVYLRYI